MTVGLGKSNEKSLTSFAHTVSQNTFLKDLSLLAQTLSIIESDFSFPFEVVPPPVDPRTMESMGRHSTNPPPTGSHDQALMAEQAAVGPQLRYLASVTVREADLRVVPYNPCTRLVAVA